MIKAPDFHNLPRASVIIPCYNDGKYLEDAVHSVERSEYKNFEIVIVDDGSVEPRTLVILDKLRQQGLRVIQQPNRGLGAARNVGITASSGDYILPLDADNRIRPQYLREAIAVLDTEPQVGVVYGDAEYFGDRNGRWVIPDFSLHRLLRENFIDACAVFRKSLWFQCGGYDEKMPLQGFEDWDLWIRMASNGTMFRHIPQILFDYRIRADSMTSVMREWSNSQAIQGYVRNKQISISIGQYADVLSSWDYATSEFSARPFRVLLRLIARAFLPRLRAHWLNRRKRSPLPH